MSWKLLTHEQRWLIILFEILLLKKNEDDVGLADSESTLDQWDMRWTEMEKETL